jgi:rsbT antagonist protein RsbS
MPISILKYGDTLVTSLPSALADEDLVQLREDLATAIGSFRAQGVIIDVTALDVIDSFATRMISNMAYTAKLRGAQTVIIGIQPEVAYSMVQLGLMLDGIETGLDLEDGQALLETLKTSARGPDL